MLSGGLPFNDRSIFRLFKKITTGKISFPGHFSSAAKSLIRSLTHKTPEKRLKITEVKNHPFFEKVDWNALMNKQWACPLDFKQFACESREKSLFEDRDYSKVEDRVIASVLI
jgi:serine/threonine protein kinase